MYSVVLLNSFVLIAVILVNTNVSALDDYRVVDTKYGKIRGLRRRTLLDNTDFYSFKGIHYAKNPIGELRFKVRIVSNGYRLYFFKKN